MGTTTTTWASGCATAPTAACVSGTWTDPGSTTNDPVVCQSAHFAVHSPAGTITAAQCTAATDQLENVVWPLYFGSPMYLPEPFCKSATKSKVSVVIHSDYGLTGGCWGNGLPGFWIGPGATADHWGLAHEFMHSVQCSVGTGLSCGQSNTCGWIYESHANWAAQQQPEYHTSNVHCSELSVNAPHLYAGSTRVRYCDWQFMEYLKDKYCYSAVNSIWLNSPAGNDPFTNIMNSRGWNISQLNDFFGEWAMHNVTWDYVDPAPESTAGGNQGGLFRKNYGLITDKSKTDRRIRTVTLDPLDTSTATNRRFVVPDGWAPQRWGYNIVRLYPDSGATSVTVTFRGVVQSAANSDFRWGLVATDSGIATPRYSQIQKGTDGALTFCVNPNESLFLVVVATPSVQKQIVWDQLYNTIYRYPYMVQLDQRLAGRLAGGDAGGLPVGPRARGERRRLRSVRPRVDGLRRSVRNGPLDRHRERQRAHSGPRDDREGDGLGRDGRRPQPGRPHHDPGQRLQHQRIGDRQDHLHAARLLRERPVAQRQRIADRRHRVPRCRLHRNRRDLLRLRRQHHQRGDQHHRRHDGRPVHLAELESRAVHGDLDRAAAQDLDGVAAHAHQRARRATGGRAAVEQIGSRPRTTASTASAVVAGGSPARLALVVVTGPPKRVTSAARQSGAATGGPRRSRRRRAPPAVPRAPAARWSARPASDAA